MIKIERKPLRRAEKVVHAMAQIFLSTLPGRITSNSNPTSFADVTNVLRAIDAFDSGIGTACTCVMNPHISTRKQDMDLFFVATT